MPVRINFRQFNVMYHPNGIVSIFNMAWADLMTFLFGRIQDDFFRARKNDLYVARHNGQVCKLRGMLNDYFDPSERRIFISEGIQSDWKYIWSETRFGIDGSPFWAKPADSITSPPKTYHFIGSNIGLNIVSHQASSSIELYDFKINIPFALKDALDVVQLKARVDYYKLPTKQYIISYF